MTGTPGACHCGSVRFVVEGPLRDVLVCHCSVCRRIHGGPANYSACASDDLTLEREDGLRWYVHNTAEYGFCADCGSSLFWRRPGNSTVSISAGALVAPTGLGTSRHIWVGSAGDYEDLETSLPRHVEGSDTPLT